MNVFLFKKTYTQVRPNATCYCIIYVHFFICTRLYLINCNGVAGTALPVTAFTKRKKNVNLINKTNISITSYITPKTPVQSLQNKKKTLKILLNIMLLSAVFSQWIIRNIFSDYKINKCRPHFMTEKLYAAFVQKLSVQKKKRKRNSSEDIILWLRSKGFSVFRPCLTTRLDLSYARQWCPNCGSQAARGTALV